MCSKKANKKTRGEILLEDWTLDIGHLKIAPIFGIHTPTPQTSGDGNIGGAQEGAGERVEGAHKRGACRDGGDTHEILSHGPLASELGEDAMGRWFSP